ncbi:MAG TPA: sulfate ABC transporter permease subunit CysT [Thermoanaerobaculia bacterium]|jgi:sulfate transport system permease protein|nr:sulfate ABC transporter permease subunit CysT [Thermoanaerobaculia bacterium]
MRFLRSRRNAVPGFAPTFGVTLLFLSLVVLLPLSALVLRATGVGPRKLIAAVTTHRALAAFGLSFGGALVAAVIAAIGGTIAAWVLVRYRFPGRRLLDALVDLPFALPTAVSGIALATLLAPQGWVGRIVEPLGWKIAYTRGGVVIAMVLVALPFIIRTLQPALADLPLDIEEAAATLGAGRLRTVARVVAPQLLPALGSGFALAFARAVGEYGSVIFVAGNLPGKTEIAPLLIIVELEQYDYAVATAIGATMLVVSFILLLLIHTLPRLVARWRGMPEG